MKKGFTLTEIMIVIAIIILLSALTLPFGINFFQEQRTEEETISLVNNLKIAQSRAMSGKNNSSWGIKFEPESSRYILFQGESFIERDAAYDEIFEMSSGTQIDGLDEIVFEKITGKPIMN